MNITKHSVVQVHYTLTNGEGQLLDSSVGRHPLTYLHGVGALIPGLENQLEGRLAGDKLTAHVNAKDAYGEYYDELLEIVPLSGFQSEGEETLMEGMEVQVETNEGPMIAVVTKIEGDDVTLDMNHPLAGMDLTFDVEIVDVRAASNEEIAHGHVHGEGGHHH
jgi:FKBP-type peptidyl-prolyl cis-trans isomerase SlyD